MHFIDEVKIFLKAGDGGPGCVGFRREKFIEYGGPNGGDGGKGGDIVLVCDSQLNTLIDFRYKQHFKAQSGENGKGQNRSGKSGDDEIIYVPIGTQVFAEDGCTLIYDMQEDAERYTIARGGDGGQGNARFKSSVNQAPRRSTPGYDGQELWVWLKLKLISDVGLIGMPNAGKSTFLSVCTSATPKIADYPFTTLKPQLGVARIGDFDEIVIADIPGLIEGASDGIGLGDKFLRHIERCKTLIHLVDISAADPIHNYYIVRKELEQYSEILSKKQEIIVLNKCDIIEDASHTVRSFQDAIKGSMVMVCSAATNFGVGSVLKEIHKMLKSTP